jgi:hypothetical protein
MTNIKDKRLSILRTGAESRKGVESEKKGIAELIKMT